MKFLVIAGGQGTKLWPVSRNTAPKQFQQLVGPQSIFTHNIQALLKAYPATDIFVSTKRKYIKYVLEQAPEISFTNLIVEPDFENGRGPGEGLAFLKLSLVAPNEPFMLIQADVLRMHDKEFLQYISDCEKLAISEKKFITGGMKALTPQMGADYIKLGNLVSHAGKVEFYESHSFVHRLGDYKKTEKLITDFHVVTHANHLTCYPHMILDLYKKNAPDWYESLMKIRDYIGAPNEESEINKIYEKMPFGQTELVTQELFDNGQMLIALVNFDWLDLGTWNNVSSFISKYGSKRKKNMFIDAEGSFAKAPDGKLVVLYGVRDAIIVDTPDALLVIDKEHTSKIGEILKQLQKKGFESFL